jgi:hypothetical protein
MEENMKGSIWMIGSTESAPLHGLMVANIQGYGLRENSMDLALSMPKMASRERANGTWGNAFAGLIMKKS